MEKICPVCHKTFETRSHYHIYCSVACRKQHHKAVYYDKDRPIPEPDLHKDVLRKFRCAKCKKLVVITTIKDRRRKFCSPHCEKLYWKHSRKRTENMNLPQNDGYIDKY